MSNHASLTGNDNCMCALQLWTLSLSWGQYETWELLVIVFNFYISQSTTIPPKSFVKFPSTEKVMSLTQTSGIAPVFLSETAPASVIALPWLRGGPALIWNGSVVAIAQLTIVIDQWHSWEVTACCLGLLSSACHPMFWQWPMLLLVNMWSLSSSTWQVTLTSSHLFKCHHLTHWLGLTNDSIISNSQWLSTVNDLLALHHAAKKAMEAPVQRLCLAPRDAKTGEVCLLQKFCLCFSQEVAIVPAWKVKAAPVERI